MTTLLLGDLNENFALTGNKKGKKQSLTGTDNDSINMISGDVGFMYDRSKGGNDVLQGGNNTSGMLANGLAGDSVLMFDSTKGGNDKLQGGNNSGGILANALAGDAVLMFDSAKGGNDKLQGGNNSGGMLINGLVGDGTLMLESSKGGNDKLQGGSNSGGILANALAGDAVLIFDSAKGGNDKLQGGNNDGGGILVEALAGDAAIMFGSAKGGNDKLWGGNNSGDGTLVNVLVGDALTMLEHARGGNDTLWGSNNNGTGNVTNILYGDARDMINPTHTDNLHRDKDDYNDDEAEDDDHDAHRNDHRGDHHDDHISDSTHAGNDHLISGINATDHMYGDAKNIILNSTPFSGTEISGFIKAWIDTFGINLIDRFLRSGESEINFDAANLDSFANINSIVNQLPHIPGANIADFINSLIDTLGSNLINEFLQLAGSRIDFDATNPVSLGDINNIVNKLRDIFESNENLTFTNPSSGGADTFIFIDTFGNDYIYDFRQSDKDQIKFDVAGVDSFDDLDISDNGNDTMISVADHGTVTLVGVTGLDLSGNISFSS